MFLKIQENPEKKSQVYMLLHEMISSQVVLMQQEEKNTRIN